MQVKDIMTTDVACCTADTSLQEVAKMMVDNDCGAIPVVDAMDSMKPIGILSDRDIVTRAVARGMNPLPMRARDIMSKAVVVVKPEESLQECLRTMEDNQVRRVPVVDKNGACIGIVAQADIALKGTDAGTAEVVEEISRPTTSSSTVDVDAGLTG